MAREEGHITRALFERNLAAKLKMPLFATDIGPLLAAGYRWDIHECAKRAYIKGHKRFPRCGRSCSGDFYAGRGMPVKKEKPASGTVPSPANDNAAPEREEEGRKPEG